MKFPTLALLAAAALTAGSCTKRPVRPQFTVVSTDSLISGNGFSCDFEYRFASIANAQDSPALAAIERMNIDRFFDLENFEGTPEEAASAAIRQVTSDMTPPGIHRKAPSVRHGKAKSPSNPKDRSSTRSFAT